MTRLLPAFLLALVLLAGGASAASADEWITFDANVPAEMQPELRDDMNRAAAYWGRAPERGPVSVEYREDVVGPNAGARAETFEGKPWGRRVFIGDYFVGGRLNRFQRCRDLVHEWGHLLGFLHRPSGDPDNVMPYLYADGTVADDLNLTAPAHINPARTCSTPEAGACASAMLATAYAAWKNLAAPTAGADCTVPGPGELAPLEPSPPAAVATPAAVAPVAPVVDVGALRAAWAAYDAAFRRWDKRSDARALCSWRAWHRDTRKARQRARAACHRRLPMLRRPVKPAEAMR